MGVTLHKSASSKLQTFLTAGHTGREQGTRMYCGRFDCEYQIGVDDEATQRRREEKDRGGEKEEGKRLALANTPAQENQGGGR